MKSVAIVFGVLGLVVMPIGAIPQLHFGVGGTVRWILRPGVSDLLRVSELTAQYPTHEIDNRALRTKVTFCSQKQARAA
jgi:hypothetical protein